MRDKDSLMGKITNSRITALVVLLAVSLVTLAASAMAADTPRQALEGLGAKPILAPADVAALETALNGADTTSVVRALRAAGGAPGADATPTDHGTGDRSQCGDPGSRA